MKVNYIIAACSLAIVAVAAEADQKFEVNYGVVKKADKQAVGLLRSKYGYTVKLIDDGKLLHLESRTEGILVGDCVSVDSNQDETRIRRVENANCSAPEPVLWSEDKRDSDVNRETLPLEKNAETAISEIEKSPACEAAIKTLQDAPMGPSKIKARKKVARECQ